MAGRRHSHRKLDATADEMAPAPTPELGGGSSAAGAILGVGVERVPLSSLRPLARNPRRGAIDAIKASLRAHGQFRPLIVNRPTGEVLAGNHTLAAMRELGFEEADVYVVAVDAERAQRIALADNRTADLASWDDAELARLLQDLGDLDGTGFERDDLDALLEELDGDRPVEDDELPPAPGEPVTRPGEVIELGRHRLVCGDARDLRVYEQLLVDARASLLWTDPPYGVAYEGRTRDRLRIRNDTAGGLAELLESAFRAVDGVLVPGAAVYVARPSGPLGATFTNAFVTSGWLLRQELVWVKDALVLGFTDYHYQHELIVYGCKPGPGRFGRGGAGWYGGNAQGTVIALPRPRSSRSHPTMKPPELVAVAVRNSTRRGELVLDPFAGSGSTLVACERLGRAARLVELDPGFCDVIIARFERLTGVRAIRGETR